MRIEIVQGDITEQRVDAIVNAANGSLMGGGGVDGAIHRRGGPAVLAESRELRRTRYPDGLPTGQAVATTAGALPATWVIHTVGPVYSGDDEDPRLLASCHTESLRVAGELGVRSLAFPAISTGAYGYPLEEAARVAIQVVLDAQSELGLEHGLVRFILFGRTAFETFEAAYQRTAG